MGGSSPFNGQVRINGQSYEQFAETIDQAHYEDGEDDGMTPGLGNMADHGARIEAMGDGPEFGPEMEVDGEPRLSQEPQQPRRRVSVKK